MTLNQRLITLLPPVLGIGTVLALWAVFGWIVANNPDTANFAGFAPGPTFARLGQELLSGSLFDSILASLSRVGKGLAFAIVIGVPTGVLVGLSKGFQSATHIPFQFLRMVSPLAWMPFAVLAFASWDGAIVFLITAAAVWPILFATAHGVHKINPDWFKVARNLGATPFQILRTVVLPAVAQDIFAGIRLALGVAWIVLVPAEYLGVTSGLGYAINDARDTLDYDRLTAIVLIIGVIGFALDGICLSLIRRFSWAKAT